MVNIPKFVPTKTSTATTYHFKIDPPDQFGWALCTVNDGTGELLITSDFGNWSHRWSADPSHLGAPTLTHFLADRNAWDYLASKLLGRSNCYEWDRTATVREFRKRLAERRLACGRRYADAPACLHDAAYLEPLRDRGNRMLTREAAREMWDELGDMEHAHDQREFLDRFMNDDDLTQWVSEQPYDELQERTSRDYEILAKGILPALIKACAAEVLRCSAMPFLTACVELDVRGSEVSKLAGGCIDRARVEMKLPEKPQSEQYRDAIGLALERVQKGVWP